MSFWRQCQCIAFILLKKELQRPKEVSRLPPLFFHWKNTLSTRSRFSISFVLQTSGLKLLFLNTYFIYSLSNSRYSVSVFIRKKTDLRSCDRYSSSALTSTSVFYLDIHISPPSNSAFIFHMERIMHFLNGNGILNEGLVACYSNFFIVVFCRHRSWKFN